MASELEYEVSVDVVMKYSFMVNAKDEDDAEEKAKELANLSPLEIEKYFSGDIEINITDTTCNDSDYEAYLELCEDEDVFPLNKNEKWEEHELDIEELRNREEMEDWYENTYLEYLKKDSQLISDLKEKKKFIKKIQDSNNPIVKVFTRDFNEKEVLFLDVSNLKGRKRFYHIPFTQTLGENEWTHQSFYVSTKLENLLDSIDIYNEEVLSIKEDEARFLVEKLKLSDN